MKKKDENGFGTLELIIIIIVVVIVGVGAWYVGKQSSKPSSTKTTTPATTAKVTTSEQPNKAMFNTYFASFNLAKLPNGEHVGQNSLPTNTTSFNSATDQLCQNVSVRKLIPSGSFSSVIYSVATKQNATSVTVFPGELGPGPNGPSTSSGCGTLGVAAGHYEYKAYVDNVLVVDIPFKVK